MKQTGYTLVELMITVAVVAILAAFALPVYNGYIESSREGVLVNNIATIQVFQEDHRLREGVYEDGNYDPAGGDTTITDAIGWEPQSDDGTTYVVALVAGGGYTVTATDDVGTTICRSFPDNVPC